MEWTSELLNNLCLHCVNSRQEMIESILSITAHCGLFVCIYLIVQTVRAHLVCHVHNFQADVASTQ